VGKGTKPTVGLDGRAHGRGEPRSTFFFHRATGGGVPEHLADFCRRRVWSGGRFARLVSARALKRVSRGVGVGVGVGRASIQTKAGAATKGGQDSGLRTQVTQVRRARVPVCAWGQ